MVVVAVVVIIMDCVRAAVTRCAAALNSSGGLPCAAIKQHMITVTITHTLSREQVLAPEGRNCLKKKKKSEWLQSLDRFNIKVALAPAPALAGDSEHGQGNDKITFLWYT